MPSMMKLPQPLSKQDSQYGHTTHSKLDGLAKESKEEKNCHDLRIRKQLLEEKGERLRNVTEAKSAEFRGRVGARIEPAAFEHLAGAQIVRVPCVAPKLRDTGCGHVEPGRVNYVSVLVNGKVDDLEHWRLPCDQPPGRAQSRSPGDEPGECEGGGLHVGGCVDVVVIVKWCCE